TSQRHKRSNSSGASFSNGSGWKPPVMRGLSRVSMTFLRDLKDTPDSRRADPIRHAPSVCAALAPARHFLSRESVSAPGKRLPGPASDFLARQATSWRRKRLAGLGSGLLAWEVTSGRRKRLPDL